MPNWRFADLALVRYNQSVGRHPLLVQPLGEREREQECDEWERSEEMAGQKSKYNASESVLTFLPLALSFFHHGRPSFSYLNSITRSSASPPCATFRPFLSFIRFFHHDNSSSTPRLAVSSNSIQQIIPTMKITFGYIAALVFAHQLLLSTTTTIPLACASPIPEPVDPVQAAQAAAAIAAAEAARRAAELLKVGGSGFSGGGGSPSDTPIATPRAGTVTPDPVKNPAPQFPAAGDASGNSLTSGGNWATNKMKMRKRAGLSGDDYISSHSLSTQTLEDTTEYDTPSVSSMTSPSSSGRSPLLERRRRRLYERRRELKEEVVSPNSPEVA
ncbi:MAG: hypothetical protein JOS17DRAFT_818675 [Linnemannia elongata]|nr:MAG: hypothetical protein JOS17DRAFT_818675 [Linnemannia elongata]